MTSGPSASTSAPQPRLEMSPLLETAAIDGLSDLFGARCANAAFGLVKLETALLERKIAKLEDPANLGFQIVDDCLVLNPQYEAGQDRVPVIHQFDVAPIVVADLDQTVRELLSPRRRAA